MSQKVERDAMRTELKTRRIPEKREASKTASYCYGYLLMILFERRKKPLERCVYNVTM